MKLSNYGTAEPLAPEADLAACMELIRAYLGNHGYHQHTLSEFEYVRACAAADAIEDADLAVHHYLALADDEELDLGELYILTYRPSGRVRAAGCGGRTTRDRRSSGQST